MPGTVVRLSLSLASLTLLAFFLVVLMNPLLLQSLPAMEHPALATFKTMFVSIVLEAFPFILLGVLVSSIIHVFVPESWIRRIVPKHPVLGVGVASVLGFVFPVCECGMVPVVRRLVRKGFPVYAGIVFLLAGPIVNPIVYTSTFLAFRSDPSIAHQRIGLALVVACLIGLAAYRWMRRSPLRSEAHAEEGRSSAPRSPHDHSHGHPRNDPGGKLIETFDHAAGEFFDMGKYLILGAFLTALAQTLVPRDLMAQLAGTEGAAAAFMMGFAYVLSICSTSDAFVASSFAGTFPKESILAFLVFGPMMDVKSTIMMLSIFRARFVLQLTLAVAFAVWMGSMLLGKLV